MFQIATLHSSPTLFYSFAWKNQLEVTQQVKVIVKRTNNKTNRNIYLSFLPAASRCQTSPHSLSHPSHSFVVTQEQFVKLFFHVIASKSSNLPQWWSKRTDGWVYPCAEICFARPELKCSFWVLSLEKLASKFCPKLQQQTDGAHSV